MQKRSSQEFWSQILIFFAFGMAASCSTPQANMKIAIASQGSASTNAGVEIANAGGNIFDVFVAISFAISVERPQSTGLGGGGFMLARHNKEVFAFDFRERAPLLSSRDMYLDANGNAKKRESKDGVKAVAVPGLVAGLIHVHRKYGVLPLKEVMKPAISMAKNGIRMYPHLKMAIQKREKILLHHKDSKKIFLKNGNGSYKVGDLFKQEDLAKTLLLISRFGANGFYKGRVANAIISQQKNRGGLITQKDFDHYRVKKRVPVKGDFRGYEIYSMPPPSSGGVHIVQMYNMIEALKINNLSSSDSIQSMVEVMRRAYHDRAKYLGDTDFVDVPVETLISKAYGKKLIQNFSINKKNSLDQLPNARVLESKDTTHFTVMDTLGNVISSTQTINGLLGSGVVAPGTGVVLNNEMDDFSIKPGVANLFGAIGGRENEIAPQKTPLSSMSPTIFLNNKGLPVLALGTPNGTRIISCVLLTSFRYLIEKKSLSESVGAFRFHHQYKPDYILTEKVGFSPKITANLIAKGYKVENKGMGCRVQAISLNDGILNPVSDPRGEGSAVVIDRK